MVTSLLLCLCLWCVTGSIINVSSLHCSSSVFSLGSVCASLMIAHSFRSICLISLSITRSLSSLSPVHN